MRPILLIALVSLLNIHLLISQDAHPRTNTGKGILDNDYPIEPVPFTSVILADSFWLPKIETNHYVTIPHALAMSENRLANFRIAANLQEGIFQSYFPFDDSDIYKIIEAASYSLYYNPDPALEEEIDGIISIIGQAQEADGYLYTARSINSFPAGFPADWVGDYRWQNVRDLSHELYNMGHLFESACAFYQATGKDGFLQIAIKAADLIDNTFGWGKLEDYPGHQIVEVGLARLYRVTGDTRYLDLAKFFLDVRGPGGPEYCQAHLKVTDQSTAVGHAVRAVYMYAGMADVAALYNDVTYIDAIGKIWEDIVTTKIYVTGGIGASGGNEGFNGPYNLPNSTAYCETCASIGNIYLNHRLFLLHGDARYIDILERTLYNSLLSGVSLSGDRFFYPNRLSSSGSDNRSEWFSCACCPPNLAKLIPSVPGYIYATKSDTLYVNLYMSDTSRFVFNGSPLELVQQTGYPWTGLVTLGINPGVAGEFTVMVRIPGWARDEAIPGDLYKFTSSLGESATITINGEDYPYDMQKGYAVVTRSWSAGDRIVLDLPMEPRMVVADDRVIDDRNRFSVQEGPLVFCAEGFDNSAGFERYMFDPEAVLTGGFDPSLLGGTKYIEMDSKQLDGSAGNRVKLIPYSMWNNRGASKMQVWLPFYSELTYPDSLIIILASDFATTNHVSEWEDINGIFDLYDPQSSSDKGFSAFGNWMHDGGTVGTWNWVQYNFSVEKTIASSEVYWWRDGAGINLPDSSYLSWYDESADSFIKIESTLKWDENILPDRYNRENFDPVKTKKIRLNFFGRTMAQGILEWKVFSPGLASPVPSVRTQDTWIKIYPNPVSGRFTIDLDYPGARQVAVQEANLNIYNSSGLLVFKTAFTGNITLNSSDIGGKGIYYINVNVNSRAFSSKIIITQ